MPLRRRRKTLIKAGETFTITEELAGKITHEEVPPLPDPPDESLRGEPWAWTKGPPYPVAYRHFTGPVYPPGYREEGDDGPG